jgi:hypothetical protein
MQKNYNIKDVIYGTAKLGDQNYGFSSGKENLFSRVEFINKLLTLHLDMEMPS